MRADPPILTIVTVVLNDRAGLEATHRSLSVQTCRRFAWFVVDGGSTDGTVDYLEVARRDIAWWVSCADNGLYHAMNRGWDVSGRISEAPYVLFLNAGDQLAGSACVARLADALENERPQFLYGDSIEQLPCGRHRFKRARSHHMAWYGMFAHHQAMVYARGLGAGVAYDCRYRIAADYAFTLDALARASSVRRLDGPVAVLATPGVSARWAELGRREQAQIRRERLGLSASANAAVSAMQWSSLTLRRSLPIVYEYLRFSNEWAGPDRPVASLP